MESVLSMEKGLIMQSSPCRILVVDDDRDLQMFLLRKLSQEGFEVCTISSVAAIWSRFESEIPFDLILSDLKMPQIDGLEFISELKRRNCNIPVILMTAYGSLETAIRAMRKGAFDYILKPIDMGELKQAIEKAHQFKKSAPFCLGLEQKTTSKEIIGESDVIKRMYKLVERVAPTQTNVLITGESGTGKELVAKALHRQSLNKDGPFIAINCSAIPENLLETELFGHSKGAFTGASHAKKGLFEEAQGGTIFLDEIGDMNLSLQAKVLRVIQEKEIKPVGETQSREINVRIVSATHKDLKACAKEGSFREDLYFRLCVIPIEIPPLRRRKEDIPLLAKYFLQKFKALHNLEVTHFSEKSLVKLQEYHWPGNVRELENVVERTAILCKTNQILPEDLPDLEDTGQFENSLNGKASQNLSLKQVEEDYINLILRKTGGKKERAAQILGIDRKTLRRKTEDSQSISKVCSDT